MVALAGRRSAGAGLITADLCCTPPALAPPDEMAPLDSTTPES
jgi:hypothetical protein